MAHLKADIKLLFKDVWDFVKEDFHPWAYLYAAVYVTGLVILAYACDGYCYHQYIIPFVTKSENGLWYAVYYCLIYFGVAIPTLAIRKERKKLCDWRFYIKAACFITLMSVSIGYTSYREWFHVEHLTFLDNYYLRCCWVYIDGIVLVVLPLAIYKYLFDRKIDGLYGLCSRTRHLNVYLTALAVLVPFVIAASFLPDFQNYYPRFRPQWFEGAMGWPNWLITTVFEGCYGLDFITTEVFFRGAMVIGMTAILDKRAVLPMCIFYCTAHFGKPCLESVSAIFGGYILGILAYKTKHIWGGVCAHLGIAFMMEIAGLLRLATLAN